MTLASMKVKKVVKLIEQNNESQLVEIDLYNEILKEYEEWNRKDPPQYESSENMRKIFLDMITMMKKSKESQIRFNNEIIGML